MALFVVKKAPVLRLPSSVDARTLARRSGLASYYSDKPCPRGHIGMRRTKDSYCRQCQRLTPSHLRRRERRAREMEVKRASVNRDPDQ